MVSVGRVVPQAHLISIVRCFISLVRSVIEMEKDSDSVKSKIGEDEKTIGNIGGHENDKNIGLPSDPDEGLSDEEKAQIVRDSTTVVETQPF